MPKRRMSLFVWGVGGVVQLVLLWGKGVGGLEVRRVCEGGRLKEEERKRPGEMGAGAGVGGGLVGEMVDRSGSITRPLRT